MTTEAGGLAVATRRLDILKTKFDSLAIIMLKGLYGNMSIKPRAALHGYFSSDNWRVSACTVPLPLIATKTKIFDDSLSCIGRVTGTSYFF